MSDAIALTIGLMTFGAVVFICKAIDDRIAARAAIRRRLDW
jgi:capsular polysaccharide biosynthesis protein